MDKLQSLLNSVNAILREEKVKKEESLRRGERFNMFQVCRVDHYEVMHSAIIASFLDPQGSHGQRDKYLKAFLLTVNDQTEIETSSCSVYTEYVTKDGRIDILIEDIEGKGIIIENKVYAADQDKQLIRYDDFSKAKYGEGNYTIYYLTLDGHEASKNSGDGIKYSPISYRKHILRWIGECVKESATTPLIRETLIQYLNHIKELTNQDMETMNKDELIKTMVNYPESIAALFSVQDDYKRYAFEHFVSSTLKKFSLDNNLIYEECNLFGYGEKGFYFRRDQWDVFAIWVYSEKNNNNSGFYWGISNYKGEAIKLDSSSYFIGGKASLGWPYGNKNLERYSNWDDMNTVAAMIKGDFANYIIEIVRQVLIDIEENNVPMK